MENVHPTLPCSPDHSRSQLLTEIVYALTSKYGELALRDGDPRRLTQWRFKDTLINAWIDSEREVIVGYYLTNREADPEANKL